MKTLRPIFVLSFILVFSCKMSIAQTNTKISTLDFVQVLNENKDEAIFYYENNWKQLRIRAVEEGYISTFQLLESPLHESEPFQIILMTTYDNVAQYEKSEENFQKLIKEQGGLKLMNDKKPGDFRKVLFSRTNVKHLE